MSTHKFVSLHEQPGGIVTAPFMGGYQAGGGHNAGLFRQRIAGEKQCRSK